MSDSWDPAQLAIPRCDSAFRKSLEIAEGLDAATAALTQQFARDGYVIFDPQIDPATLDAVISSVAGRFGYAERGYTDELRIQDAWKFSPAVRMIAGQPRTLAVLTALYGQRPIPFQTLNFRRGSEQSPHADSIHFNSFPHGFMCGVWLALEDVDDDNGPLVYYPGSHRLPFYDMQALGLRGLVEDYAGYEQAIAELLRVHGFQPQRLHVRRGQALVWAANLVHGGAPIRDQARTRLSQVTHYYFEGCSYYVPIRSDVGRGQIDWRAVVDVRTGEFVQNTRPEWMDHDSGGILGLPHLFRTALGQAVRRSARVVRRIMDSR